MLPFDRDTREAPQTKPTLLLDVCREQTRDLFGVLWADQLCDLCRARDCLALFRTSLYILKMDLFLWELAELSVCFIWHEKIIKPVLCKLQYELSQCPTLLLDELQLLATSRNAMAYAKYSLLSLQREKRNNSCSWELFCFVFTVELYQSNMPFIWSKEHIWSICMKLQLQKIISQYSNNWPGQLSTRMQKETKQERSKGRAQK